jgi:hypothetical protein
MLSENEVARILRAGAAKPDNAFEILQSLCWQAGCVQESAQPHLQELVLRALDQREAFRNCGDMLNGLVRHLGLYPYLDVKELGLKDAIARELHRPSVMAGERQDGQEENLESEKGLVFHRVQAEVFRLLLNGKNVILSAPTSFGKSSLIDALIDTGKFSNIVIVVPTIALIDETRRRLVAYKETHKVITHASQALSRQNVFVLTQERAVDFPDLPDIDLFVLDEFYKLDPRGDAPRAMTLNHAFYKLTKKAKQFYLLGPNIHGVPPGFLERFRSQFIRTDFATVVTELIPVTSQPGQEMERLLSLCGELKGPTLVYCSSPGRVRKVTELLAEGLPNRKNGMADAAKWTAQHYHSDWTLVKGFKGGVGMHHGRMPRALAQLSVKGFNGGELDFLVCTSTLIEGVNTKAKNVVIFDHKIGAPARNLDYFTFNNIRGRSGRMFKHFIGKVFIFHDPPHPDLPFVEVPVFSQDENLATDGLLIQIEETDLAEAASKRLEPLRQQQVLSWDVLRQNSSIEPADQLALARHILETPRTLNELGWSGFPDWEQLVLLCEVIWKHLVHETGRVHGVSSGRQLAFRLAQLRNTPLKELIANEMKGKDPKEPDDAVEDVLEFIRQWPTYRLPKLAMAVSRIHREVAQRKGRTRLANYAVYVGQLESLFSDPALSALDEYGLPFPLAKKLESKLAAGGSLDASLRKLAALRPETVPQLSHFERQLVEDVKKSI